MEEPRKSGKNSKLAKVQQQQEATPPPNGKSGGREATPEPWIALADVGSGAGEEVWPVSRGMLRMGRMQLLSSPTS